MKLGVELPDGNVDGVGPETTILPWDPNPAPPGIKVALVVITITLNNLQDIELIIVVGD